MSIKIGIILFLALFTVALAWEYQIQKGLKKVNKEIRKRQTSIMESAIERLRQNYFYRGHDQAINGSVTDVERFRQIEREIQMDEEVLRRILRGDTESTKPEPIHSIATSIQKSLDR